MSARLGLADQVAARLLALITDGRHPPGTRLPSEAVLAQEAQVSRLTLREAVRILRDKGVLSVEQGRGTFVNPPARWVALDPMLVASRTALEGGGAELAERITETRRIVEVGVAELAARRRSEEDLAHLRGSTERMRRAHEDGDVVAFSAADVDFHGGLMTAACNPFLAALLEPINVLVQEVRLRTSFEPEMRLAALTSHAAILDAVAAGDEVAARCHMAEHLEEARRAIDRLRALPGHLDPVAGMQGAERDVS